MNNQPVGRKVIEELMGSATFEAVHMVSTDTPHDIIEHALTNDKALKAALHNVDVDLYLKEYEEDVKEFTELQKETISNDYEVFKEGVLFGFALGIVFFKKHGYVVLSALLETKTLTILNESLVKNDCKPISEEDLNVQVSLMSEDPDNAYELHLKRLYGEVH